MNDPFARLGLAIVRYRWIVLGFWLVVLGVAGALLAPHAAGVMKSGSLVAPGSESDIAATILEEQFNLSTLNNAPVVFRSEALTVSDLEYQRDVEAAVERVSQVDGVRGVVTFFNTGNPVLVSDDGRTSVAIVSLEGDEGEVQHLVPTVRDALDGTTLETYLTGTPGINYDFTTQSERDLQRAELVTLPVVLLLLVLTFRTGVSAAVPLVLGGSAVILAMSILYVVGSQTDVSIYAVNVASMIGLGLGIDFSLIIVNRFREEVASGRDVPTATAVTMATAGRSILYSGMTVLLGMVVLTVMFDLLVIRSISFGVMLVAMTALVTGLTLLPALLAILGHRLEWLRVIPQTRRAAGDDGFWYRFSHRIMRRPWPWLAAATVLLLVIAYPAKDIELLGNEPKILPATTESVEGVHILDEVFGPNRLTPIQIVMQTDEAGGAWTPEFLGALAELTDRIADDPRTADVTSLDTFLRDTSATGTPIAIDDARPEQFTSDPQLAAAVSQFVNLSGANDTAVISIVSRHDEFSDEHEAQIHDLRDHLLTTSSRFAPYTFYVGGSAASFYDFSDTLYGRFPYLVGAVLLLSFVILMMFFQSVFLPFKAILMNVAGVLATYGVLVAIFQYGWGDHLFGFEALGAIGVATPAILFVILFCLSTDYEVFMLSRVREYYHELGDNEEAVARGLEHTAGVITAAGLILIGVFGSFATAGVISIKEIGLGLAVAILIDTTIIRVVMVPSTMRLMGDLNWWMPDWLKRIVPEIKEGYLPELEPALAIQGTGTGAILISAGGLVEPASDADDPVRITGQLRPIGGSVGADLVPLPRSRPFIIGRDRDADLQVFDRRISRRHARIDHLAGEFVMTDLNSTNGVFVNNVLVDGPVTLRQSDEIRIGTTGQLRFRFELRPLSEALPDVAGVSSTDL